MLCVCVSRLYLCVCASPSIVFVFWVKRTGDFSLFIPFIINMCTYGEMYGWGILFTELSDKKKL